jgi:hypothetical protein
MTDRERVEAFGQATADLAAAAQETDRRLAAIRQAVGSAAVDYNGTFAELERAEADLAIELKLARTWADMLPPGPQYRALKQRETEVRAELRGLRQRLRDRGEKRTDG